MVGVLDELLGYKGLLRCSQINIFFFLFPFFSLSAGWGMDGNPQSSLQKKVSGGACPEVWVGRGGVKAGDEAAGGRGVCGVISSNLSFNPRDSWAENRAFL